MPPGDKCIDTKPIASLGKWLVYCTWHIFLFELCKCKWFEAGATAKCRSDSVVCTYRLTREGKVQMSLVPSFFGRYLGVVCRLSGNLHTCRGADERQPGVFFCTE